MPGEPESSAKRMELEKEILELRRARQLLQLLANATNILISDNLDYEVRLKNLAEVIVPNFADWCAINIIAPARLSYTVVTAAGEDKKKLAEEIARKYPPEREYRYGVAEVIRSGQATLYPAMPDELIRRTTVNAEHYELLKKLGIVSVMVVPMISQHETIGAITFVTAESGYRYSEDDLAIAKQLAHRAAVALENALLYAEVAEANRAKEKFLAMLAHELRNPLTPVRNSLPILAEKGKEDYEIRDIANIMDRQIAVMNRLLDDLFDVARATAGKIRFHTEDLELPGLLRHAAETMRPELERKGLQFSVYLAGRPVHVHGDRVRLEQIVINLLGNAAKYTPAGGHVTLECELEGKEAVIRVRDTGKGIPPHMLEKIFQLFVQVDQSLDRPEGGLGLGLTLVQMLTERHGGRVSARSEGPGRGSEFIVRLPVVPEPETKPGPAERRPAADEPKRILVVDDNEDAANSIGKLLRRLGHSIRVAYDGISALEIAQGFNPEAVLLDIGLPLMDGYEAAARFRELYKNSRPDLLLVALSGYGQEEDRAKSREAGFNYHLVKPFDTQELRNIINAWPQKTG